MRRALLALLLALIAAPAASAHVYWANKYDDAIGRATLAGAGADQSFVGPLLPAESHPVGLAVDGEHLYWSNYENGDSIGRTGLNGGAVDQTFIPAAHDPVGVAVGGGYLFWTNAATGTIGRARLDGTGVRDLVTGIDKPYGLAVAGGNVYWSSQSTGVIGRARLDGTDQRPSFLTGASHPTALAAGSAHLYWADPGHGAIGRSGLDGLNADPDFIPAPGDPWGVAVDARHVYWTNQGPPKTVARAGLDGKNPEPAFLPASPFGVYGIAVAPLRTAVAGHAAAAAARFDLRSSEPGGFDCALDGRPLAPCGPSVAYAGLAAGSHRFLARAHAGADVDPTPAAFAWRVASPPAPLPRPRDTQAPVVSRLKLRRKLSFRLSERAAVAFALTRRGSGRLVRAFSRRGRAGRNRLSFSRRHLRAGHYRLLALAVDPAGNRSHTAKTAFTLARRR